MTTKTTKKEEESEKKKSFHLGARRRGLALLLTSCSFDAHSKYIQAEGVSKLNLRAHNSVKGSSDIEMNKEASFLCLYPAKASIHKAKFSPSLS